MDINFINTHEVKVAPKLIRRPSLKEAMLVFGIIVALITIAFNWGPIYENIRYAFSGTDREDIYYRQIAKIYRDETSDDTLLPTHVAVGSNSSANLSSALSAGSSNVVVTGNYIEIPKLKVYAPLVETGNGSADSVLEGLKYGVVRYVDGGTPVSGQTIILGHSSSRLPSKYGSIFALLAKLEVNDVIHIRYKDKNYSYFVKSKQTGPLDEMKLRNFEGDLVLTSCWPTGSSEGRITVSAMKAIDND